MTPTQLHTQTDETGILTITINREEKLNALNTTLLSELVQVLQNHRDSDTVKGVILTGAGSKAFAAGADISEFAGFNAKEGKEMVERGYRIFKTVEQYPKPIIAAVNGFALGGGCELAMACHLRVASPNAKFGQPEVNLGIIPGYGGTQRLIQLVGKGKALELLMTADIIAADEALRLGLVNYVVPQEELMTKCREILGKITAKAPLAIKKVIACVDSYFTAGENGYETEMELFASCFGTHDFKEGTEAFMTKRKANFTGS
ncbi:MAG: enoyl-CoA hydratase/isomerase family protein [Sphingobacteriales bacterium]|nr:MAG: enoyl-CoA hydratase/isomerase family protein [Sphingobacteriales bacterium]